MDILKIPLDFPQPVLEWIDTNCTNVTNRHQYCAYLTVIDGEIVERTFACREYKNGQKKYTEVRRRATGTEKVYVKNLTFSMWGNTPVYENKIKRCSSRGYSFIVFDKDDYDKWYEADSCNLWYDVINPEILKTVEEYTYCGFKGGDLIEYLKKYKEHKNVEIFSKLNIPLNISLIKKAEKDKRFQNYLCKNREQIAKYGAQATVYAFNNNVDIADAANTLYKRKQAYKYIPALSKTNVNPIKIVEWCDKCKIKYSLYNDYFEAIKDLGLNLNDTKNIYPKNFKRMHDLRIDEYEAQKMVIDRKKRKKVYEAFAKEGIKASAFEIAQGELVIVSAKGISELKKEGNALRHCVGKMGYDVKMAEGRSWIMFVRQAKHPDTPFVTVEYDPKSHKILQAYGIQNSCPPENVQEFLEKWVKKNKKRKVA